MSEELSDKKKITKKWSYIFLLPFWTLASFALAQGIVIALFYILDFFNISFKGVNEAIFSSVVSSVVYILSITIVVLVPYLLKKRKTTLKDLGCYREVSWKDIFLSPAGFIVYIFLSAVLLAVISRVIPGFNASEVQEIGYNSLGRRHEYILAFLTLVVVAPVAEEVLFRGYLYGKLRKEFPIWLSILVTSVLFAVVHGQWNVGIDVFALSVVMCILRELTNSIWAGVLLHMMKNGLAFYILFINSSLISTIGG